MIETTLWTGSTWTVLFLKIIPLVLSVTVELPLLVTVMAVGQSWIVKPENDHVLVEGVIVKAYEAADPLHVTTTFGWAVSGVG